ncbi:aspartate carbamoyltransferase regulatory subunit [Clostridiaceae bacterium NSJ-31]|uniref:Aspartate carbamoyltransferase regulatory subunit n=1 Tax=Ligaoa zhengdingensis TaxID=2763658 RepID=A0A926I3T8_9FIRM|nr:aspartate carbamoyltransferase regulatory subunit [Ligaoa zhengdingensis]MBC8546679.1 aspartate carbamoyltransferase regulatory subunit [Ligaoa zhengdingensis]
MLNVDSLNKGVVIDHIHAGKAMEIYRYLNLDRLDCSVAIIKNARSHKMGRKDIIKIDENIDINLDVLGFIDPDITVNIINEGGLIEKRKLKLPEQVINVIKCKNPRCITSVEQEIQHIFKLADAEKGVYRCIYCEQEHQRK